MSDEMVIVVDTADNALGTLPKLAAHRSPGVLHRAFSVLLTDGHGRLLMQRRAAAKATFAGLWANTCCSHPRPGEAVLDGARRRLLEELELEATGLRLAGQFTYRAVDPTTGLVEHEIDHVVVGTTTGQARLNPRETDAVRWLSAQTLADEQRRGQLPLAPWVPSVLALASAALASPGKPPR